MTTKEAMEIVKQDAGSVGRDRWMEATEHMECVVYDSFDLAVKLAYVVLDCKRFDSEEIARDFLKAAGLEEPEP